MISIELLDQLQRLGVKLWVDGDRLRYDAPAGALTPELRAEIGNRKREIIKFLQEVASSASAKSRPILPAPRTSRLPLSFAQQRLWFLDQLVTDSSAYNMSAVVCLEGELDQAALQKSLDELVHRHEGLRTVFPCHQGNPVQMVCDAKPVPVEMLNLQHIPQELRRRQARSLIDKEVARPFILSSGPLCRAKVFRLSQRDHLLMLVMHHIVCDGWSLRILFSELSALYKAFVQSQPSPLPELPIQYADFSVWQRQWLQGEVMAKQLNPLCQSR